MIVLMYFFLSFNKGSPNEWSLYVYGKLTESIPELSFNRTVYCS